MTPRASISRRNPAARSQQLRSVAARVCRTVDAMPPPRSRDVEIAPAPNALLELVGPPAAKREMGVAVDQAGNHQPPARIDPLGLPVLGRQLSLRADPADHATHPTTSAASGISVDVALPALSPTGGQLRDVVQQLQAAARPSRRKDEGHEGPRSVGDVSAGLNQSSVSRPPAPWPSVWRDHSPHRHGA